MGGFRCRGVGGEQGTGAMACPDGRRSAPAAWCGGGRHMGSLLLVCRRRCMPRGRAGPCRSFWLPVLVVAGGSWAAPLPGARPAALPCPMDLVVPCPTDDFTPGVSRQGLLPARRGPFARRPWGLQGLRISPRNTLSSGHPVEGWSMWRCMAPFRACAPGPVKRKPFLKKNSAAPSSWQISVVEGRR